MTSPSIVRQASPKDEAELWRLLRLLHSENSIFPISERKVQYYLDRILHPETIAADDTGPRGFMGVIGPIGALEGCIMLQVGSFWYSEEMSLEENFNFVDPAHRSSNHAKALISFAKECSQRVGVKLVIGVLSTTRTAAKVRLYERFLQPAGCFFIFPFKEEVALRISSEDVNDVYVPAPKKKKKFRLFRSERLALKADRVNG